ncbi:MAG: MBL fold metallo-hydrolase [Lentisphaeria bacterium]|nr:MBL fold metallo-hydrolase [Lentisphaeria bacterium]
MVNRTSGEIFSPEDKPFALKKKMNSVSVKWYGTNALEFRHSGGSFMIDPYVSRDREKLYIPTEVDKYITSTPDFILMTHAHWDHLPDMPHILKKCGAVLYASRTACMIMRAYGVPENQLYELSYGETLHLPGNVTVTALESRHMGLTGEAEGYSDVPPMDELQSASGWKCGETFAFLIEVDGQKILNLGTANMLEDVICGTECDHLFCGISRWKDGFPEMLMRNIRFRHLIPTHHDEFKLPLDQFYLRNDLARLADAIPGLTSFEIPVLQWTDLP